MKPSSALSRTGCCPPLAGCSLPAALLSSQSTRPALSPSTPPLKTTIPPSSTAASDSRSSIAVGLHTTAPLLNSDTDPSSRSRSATLRYRRPPKPTLTAELPSVRRSSPPPAKFVPLLSSFSAFLQTVRRRRFESFHPALISTALSGSSPPLICHSATSTADLHRFVATIGLARPQDSHQSLSVSER